MIPWARIETHCLFVFLHLRFDYILRYCYNDDKSLAKSRHILCNRHTRQKIYLRLKSINFVSVLALDSRKAFSEKDAVWVNYQCKLRCFVRKQQLEHINNF